MNEDVKKEVLDVMGKHELCVLSTVSPQQKPESAMVGFSCSEGLELLVGTGDQTRKYLNLQTHPNVPVVVGDREAEVQYEGTARRLEHAELEERLTTHFAKLPGTTRYQEDPSQVWLLITPTWVRLTVHENPNRVEELRFEA